VVYIDITRTRNDDLGKTDESRLISSKGATMKGLSQMTACLTASNSYAEPVVFELKMIKAHIPYSGVLSGVAGTLSPAAVSPYVLAGEGS
jgi:hypothetical protein